MMTDIELSDRVRHALQLQPTAEQEHAIRVFGAFMTHADNHTVMIMRGAAGTGKTMIAVEKATRHAIDGDKVLFLCYNAFLRDMYSPPTWSTFSDGVYNTKYNVYVYNHI